MTAAECNCRAFAAGLLDGLAEACLLVDGSGHLVMANDAARQLLEIRAKASGRRLDALLQDPAAVDAVAEVLQRGRSVEVEFQWKPEGGALRPTVALCAVISPVMCYEREKVARLVVRPARPPEQAQRKSVGVMDELRRLHDPLAIIRGYLETLEDGHRDPGTLEKALQSIRKASDRIENVLGALYQKARALEKPAE